MANHRSHLPSASPAAKARFAAASRAELTIYARARIAEPMPDDVFAAIVDTVGAKGRGRDAMVCPICHGVPNPLTYSPVCAPCYVDRYVDRNHAR